MDGVTVTNVEIYEWIKRELTKLGQAVILDEPFETVVHALLWIRD